MRYLTPVDTARALIQHAASLNCTVVSAWGAPPPSAEGCWRGIIQCERRDGVYCSWQWTIDPIEAGADPEVHFYWGHYRGEDWHEGWLEELARWRRGARLCQMRLPCAHTTPLGEIDQRL